MKKIVAYLSILLGLCCTEALSSSEEEESLIMVPLITAPSETEGLDFKEDEGEKRDLLRIVQDEMDKLTTIKKFFLSEDFQSRSSALEELKVRIMTSLMEESDVHKEVSNIFLKHDLKHDLLY